MADSTAPTHLSCSCGCGEPIPISDPPPSRCSLCRSTFYLNRDCQKQHFTESHKKYCYFLSTIEEGSLGYCNKDLTTSDGVIIPKGSRGLVLALASDVVKQVSLLPHLESPILSPSFFISFEASTSPISVSGEDLFWCGTSRGESTKCENLFVSGAFHFVGSTSSPPKQECDLLEGLRLVQESVTAMKILLEGSVDPVDPWRDDLLRLIGARNLFLGYCYIDGEELDTGRHFLKMSLFSLSQLNCRQPADEQWARD
jgi:hypothetical protein